MTMSRAVWLAYLAVVATLIGVIALLLPGLPERIATKFDFSGNPTAWMTHRGFVVTTGVLVAVFTVMFLGAGLLTRVPDRLINLPHKDHWLAPQRRAGALGYIVAWVRWLTVMALGIVTMVLGLALRANLSQPPRMPTTAVWLILAIVAVTLGMIVLLVRRFRRA